MGVTAQQVPEIERVTVTFILPDRLQSFSAEVPLGPIRTCVVVTEVIAEPLHWNHCAPVRPTAVATNTRETRFRSLKL